MKKSEITTALKKLSKTDKVMKTLIKKIGYCGLKAHNDYFFSLFEAIIGQQLSMSAAESITNKVENYFRGTISPEILIKTEDNILRSLGLSNQKIRYIKDLSEKIISGEINFKKLIKLHDKEIIGKLTKVKGIGTWTAHMFLIFTLFRPNVLPVGDLGIKRAIMNNYGLRKLPTEDKIIEISKKYKWEPYCTLTSWYLWKSLNFEK